MKLVDNKYAAATLVARQRSNSLNEFFSLSIEYQRLSFDRLKDIFSLLNNPVHFEELFFFQVKWYEVDLVPNERIINKTFDTLLKIKGLHNYNLLQIKSILNQFPESEIEKVNNIRKTLSPNPRIICTTTNWKQFNLYDGWHTSLAFCLEECKIPAFVGYSNSFGFYY
ncbi:MAG: hypothetical protein AB9834_00200 [Lentimicrobium sp.]